METYQELKAEFHRLKTMRREVEVCLFHFGPVIMRKPTRREKRNLKAHREPDQFIKWVVERHPTISYEKAKDLFIRYLDDIEIKNLAQQEKEAIII